MAGPCCAPADASNVDTSRLPRAFLISMGATLCSVLGSSVILFNRKPSRKFLAFGLSFSSGVMIFLSLYEMLGNSSAAFKTSVGKKYGLALSLAMFITGIAVTHGLSHMVHYLQRKSGVNTCECESSDTDTKVGKEADETGCAPDEAPGNIMTMQSAMMVGLALALHNLPEGFAMFFAAASDLKAGLPLTKFHFHSLTHLKHWRSIKLLRG
jgi:ZIP family zinc transporter